MFSNIFDDLLIDNKANGNKSTSEIDSRQKTLDIPKPKTKQESTKTANIEPKKTDTIFINMASYRDSQCIPTILNLLEKRSGFTKIVIGLCQQIDLKQDAQLDVRRFFGHNRRIGSHKKGTNY